MLQEVYIVAAQRTPIGSFGGMLSGFSATELGGFAIRAALAKAGVAPREVEEVLMGNVVSANVGQAPARQAALLAGLESSVCCTTINKVCASGAKAIMFGAQRIMLGQADVIVAGGMESMSNAPFYVPKARFGYKYGSATLVDALEKDGLLDVYDQCAMGVFADRTAHDFGISRQAQDAFAVDSYQRAAAATAAGYFKNEIVGVEIPQKRGPSLLIDEDEEFKNVIFDKIPTLKPAFSKDGTVTAANASTINDGAAAVVLMSKRKADALGIKPLAKIIGFADAEHEPRLFTTAPTSAVPRALTMAGIDKDTVDFYEINEAFAVVPLVFEQQLGIAHHKVNVFGGGVSLGHPLGASGARIVATLVNVLHQKNGEFGAIGICNGGGGASAIVVQRV